jgi:hypothetical protein
MSDRWPVPWLGCRMEWRGQNFSVRQVRQGPQADGPICLPSPTSTLPHRRIPTQPNNSRAEPSVITRFAKPTCSGNTATRRIPASRRLKLPHHTINRYPTYLPRANQGRSIRDTPDSRRGSFLILVPTSKAPRPSWRIAHTTTITYNEAFTATCRHQSVWASTPAAATGSRGR